VTAGGVLAAGESYDDGARRELGEELGVAAEPEALFPFHYADAASVVHGMVYRVVHDGPFRLQPEEIVRGEFVPLGDVAARAAAELFCPDALAVLAEYQRRQADRPVRVLLGSGGFRTPERIGLLAEQMRSFFGPVGRLLFVPYALADHEGYRQQLVGRGLNASYDLDGLHHHPDPVAAVTAAEALFVGGGNTFRLLDALYRLGLLDAIRARVRQGLPYLGISAGANVACPTIKTTNDMPIVQPPSLDALGLVPFQVNPHYFTGQTFVKGDDGSYHEHFGETRDERLRQFHEENATPVVGLWEGGLLRVEGGQTTLLGAPARVFRRGHEPVDVEPGAQLDAWLAPVRA
jgi:dipeptidase E